MALMRGIAIEKTLSILQSESSPPQNLAIIYLILPNPRIAILRRHNAMSGLIAKREINAMDAQLISAMESQGGTRANLAGVIEVDQLQSPTLLREVAPTLNIAWEALKRNWIDTGRRGIVVLSVESVPLNPANNSFTSC